MKLLHSFTLELVGGGSGLEVALLKRDHPELPYALLMTYDNSCDAGAEVSEYMSEEELATGLSNFADAEFGDMSYLTQAGSEIDFLVAGYESTIVIEDFTGSVLSLEPVKVPRHLISEFKKLIDSIKE